MITLLKTILMTTLVITTNDCCALNDYPITTLLKIRTNDYVAYLIISDYFT